MSGRFSGSRGQGRESGETQMSRLSENVDMLIAAGHPVNEAIQLALDPDPKPLPGEVMA
jgi:hypothetical protein